MVKGRYSPGPVVHRDEYSRFEPYVADPQRCLLRATCVLPDGTCPLLCAATFDLVEEVQSWLAWFVLSQALKNALFQFRNHLLGNELVSADQINLGALMAWRGYAMRPLTIAGNKNQPSGI